MTNENARKELFLSRLTEAVAHSRSAKAQLCDEVIPILPPQKRCLAMHVTRAIARDDFLNEGFLQSVEALTELLLHEDRDNTQTAWIADDCDTQGGHAIDHRDVHSDTRWSAVEHLDLLYDAVCDVVNLLTAERIIAEVMD